MTEQEWLTSSDPAAMLRFLRLAELDWNTAFDAAREVLRRTTDRKMRLFACACCSANGTEVGVVDEYELTGPPSGDGFADHTDLEWAQQWLSKSPRVSQRQKADFWRELIGNPFQTIVCPATLWGRVSWVTPTAVAIATDIYENRDFGLMGVLADALEEAGCKPSPGRTISQVLKERKHPVMGGCCERFDNMQACDCLETAEPDGLLEHLWLAGPHIRGCWVLDLLLGKE